MRNFLNYFRNMDATNKLLFFVSMSLIHHLVAMETKVNFPIEYIKFSKMVKNKTADTQGDIAEITLPASQETINDVLAIFKSYNSEGDQTKIRDQVKNYSLSKLVMVTNLLQHLDVSDDIMEIVMNQIAAELNNKLRQLLSSLNDYVYGQNKNIVLPYYEPLRKLNPDVEKTIKEKSFKIKTILQLQVQDIWARIGVQNSEQKSKQERDLFQQGTETIASFLERNVSIPVIQFIVKHIEAIDNKDEIPHDKISAAHTIKKSVGSRFTAFVTAAMTRLRAFYNYYIKPVQ